MPLQPGTRLGPYQVTAPLGAGGMGEVYRARDTSLDREVAIKVLPDAFANDPERLARFEREAKVLASLNHPNIGGIHGLEKSGDTRALVLELVEGPTLADRIAEGPIPIDDALPIAKQIAEALEAAHERGIIHRDLKPANIKLRPDGAVKVLDFGLAKLHDVRSPGTSVPGSPDQANSPTLTAAASQLGVIMGTAAYMSPEQARGKTIDRRADIWAFGVVLYELLTGRQLFAEATVSDTLASVLRADIDWSALPSDLPLELKTLLERCLRRDASRRLPHIGSARLELDEASAVLSDSPVGAVAAGRRAAPWTVGALVTVVASSVTWMIARPEVDRSVARLSIVVPTGLSLTSRFSSNVALSDDGETIAFTTGDGEGSRLHIRRMDVLESMTVEGGAGARTPFISPDGQWVAFFADDELMKVSVDGGVPTVIADAPGPGYAGDWGPDDMIVYAPAYNSGLALVSANGGAVEDLTAPVTGAGELGHWFPEFLPDGDSVLFTVYAGPTGNRTEILTLSTGERRTLLEGVTYARYVSTGHLIYPTASKTMMAVPFDAATLEVTGPPTVVLEDVVYARDGNSQFSVSASGTLAYVRASTLSTDRLLLWVDRDGVRRPVIADRHGYMAPELSPDESRLAVAIEDVDSDIWVLDLGRGTLSRVTFNPGLDIAPLWTADGGRLLFGSEQGGPAFDLFWTAPDGSRDPEELLLTSFDKTPQSLSPDGTRLAFQVSHPESGEDIWTVPLQGGGVAEPFVRTPYDERIPMFSPDGRWIAYASNESGRFEIYVQAFPVAGRKTLVSAGGGTSPRWARNGREIFYRNEDRMMAVEVDGTGAELTVGAATTLFVGDYQRTDILEAEYDVTADGQHFIMIGRDPNASEHRIEVVLNWSEELLERVPIP